jgi:mannose-6-phosphate isomerase-like protein (cupin superfamily)
MIKSAGQCPSYIVYGHRDDQAGSIKVCISKPVIWMDRERIRQDWRSRGFSCDLWVDPPGQVWEDYVHSVYELVLILEGELELEMQGRAFRSRTGEEVFIPANVQHSVRNVGGTTARWLYGYRRSRT